ncbi:MAG: FHA domain-containing protein [Thermoguttaceae bacterium]|jgi:pSer/pThr/pTyr-binding forkhead associated (FHA) protein
MQAVLETIAGPHLGKRITVRAGQTAAFGRTERADFAFPLDPHMSSLHFVVECQHDACQIRDPGSANGTFVNGKRIQEAVLHEADVIQAGKTNFLVHIEVPVAEAEPIPDYLKGIVPSTRQGEAVPGSPVAEVPSDPQKLPWRSELDYAPSGEFLRPDVQPAAPSFLPPVVPPVAAPGPSAPATTLSPGLSGTLRLVIEAVGGPHVGTRISLRAGDSIKVGRTDRADLVLARDTGLSGLHFAIQGTPRGFEICDLGSTNGTLLNGETVAATPLSDGDEIRAGQSRFKVRLEGSASSSSPDPQRSDAISFPDGLRDPDPRVRREALFAAVWTGQPSLLGHCRKQAESPTAENWDAVLMLAVLGKPGELLRIDAVSRAEALGPRRFLVCGAFGHPTLVDGLLDVMGSSDAAIAAMAGTAFRKITGVDVDSPRRAEVVLEEGGPPADVFLPDVERARACWKELQGKFSRSTRVCRGFDLSDRVSEEVFAELDMESRWEICLRGRFYGTWRGNLRDLESLTRIIHGSAITAQSAQH